jgi:cytochrome P450
MSLWTRLSRIPRQLAGHSPFGGTLRARRLPLLKTLRVTGRNLSTPLKILDHVFADDESGDLQYIDVPGIPPILFVRDPELIRLITVGTANAGDFDRDTMPTGGIGRVVGKNNLLYSQGDRWHKHKLTVARTFGTKAVQTPEVFHELENAIRDAVAPQLEALVAAVRQSPTGSIRMRLEPEIKAVMLDVLVNVLFGTPIGHDELRTKYLPAIERVIRYILLDTVLNPFGIPTFRIPALTSGHSRLKADRLVFEELVDRVIASRVDGVGFWPLLTVTGHDDAIRSNVRVFLAGALEATASYISWALGNLARDPVRQELTYREAMSHRELSPQSRESAVYLQNVLSETLRLNASLYFLPRVAVRETTVATSRGTLRIPAETHLILGTYHTTRCERFWGVAATGYPATDFVPERWTDDNMKRHGRSTKDNLHFGFGHGPRVCVGKHFSEAEAFVCITLFLKRFRIAAVHPRTETDSGVSTRPKDQLEVELRLRE